MGSQSSRILTPRQGFIMLPFCIIAASVVTLPGNKATPGGGPPPPKPNIKALFQIRSYLVYAFGAWFSYIGLFTGLFFIAAYGVSRGMSQSLAFYLVAITNAASLFGRILPGFLADRYGSLNLYVIFGALSGVITMCLTAATSSAAIVVIAVAYGFTSGVSLWDICRFYGSRVLILSHSRPSSVFSAPVSAVYCRASFQVPVLDCAWFGFR